MTFIFLTNKSPAPYSESSPSTTTRTCRAFFRAAAASSASLLLVSRRSISSSYLNCSATTAAAAAAAAAAASAPSVSLASSSEASHAPSWTARRRWEMDGGVRREHVCSGTFQFVKVVGCGLCGVCQVVWAKMLGYTDRGSSLGSG